MTTTSENKPTVAGKPQKQPGTQRAAWLKTLHQWHWISSALCLLCMVLFSFTGITLNHGAQIESKPKVSLQKAALPPALLDSARQFAAGHDGTNAALPDTLQAWLADTQSIRVGDKPAEWSAEEMYLPMPKPGGDAWLRIDLASGAVEYELTDRGWIAWLNDLHKGRHTGDVWFWFIDIFAVACLVFSLTGLLILKFHAANRPSTWPIVGLGVLIPLLLAALFIH